MSKIILIINPYHKAIFQSLSMDVLYSPSSESVNNWTIETKWFCMLSG